MLRMRSVFISSVISGFESVRASAREAVESAGFRPVMAETAGALPVSPRTGLLQLVASSDIYLLILGNRYGQSGDSGFSPTEDEFNEAKRRNRRIIVLKQAVEMEPAEQEFLDRVAGRWEEGLFYATFADERDIALKVVRALTNLRQLDDVSSLLPIAQERAAALAGGDNRAGFYGGGGEGRIVFAPIGGQEIIDPVTLDDQQVVERLAAVAREAGLVPQSLGIVGKSSGQGFVLVGGDERNPTIQIEVQTDGAVVVTKAVVGSDGHFGAMHVDPDRLAALLSEAAVFAGAAYDVLDRHRDVDQLAVTAAIIGANGRVFGRPPSTNSMSLGGSHSLPQVVLAPQPALAVRRADLGSADWRTRVTASIKRVFADAGAVAG